MHARPSRFALFLGAAVALLSSAGCAQIRYVTQAAAGQEQLNEHGIAIDEVVSHGYLDRRTRSLLAEVPRIKAFGERHGLKHTTNYQRYVWLDRDAVVWVVSACDPLAFRPKAWTFPVVGSITYTGWFDQREARSYARELATAGWDVDVRPSEAYSTLGYFDDPILSTMLAPGDEALGDLADVVLHETLHATFYVPGQSTLNESVASFFGDRLAERYLDARVGPASREKARFLELRARGEARGRLMREAYESLEELYASSAPRADKLVAKKRIVDRLRAELALKRPVTNATLIQYKTYGSGKKELSALLDRCGGDFERMLKALDRVRTAAEGAAPHTDPAELLKPVVAGGC